MMIKMSVMMNRRISISILFVAFIVSSSCNGQDFQYKTVPSAYIPSANSNYKIEAQNLQSSAVDLKKYLPTNYVIDGSVDYTKQLQNGIDANRVVLMPNFAVRTSGIHLNNYNTLIFQKNSQLLMMPSKESGYQVLAINNVHDVNVYFAKIVGDRARHIGIKGEWGFGIGIQSASNVKIIGANVSNCWGDGIYISEVARASQKGKGKANNILIDGARLDNNRRNGLSLIGGTNITISNSLISNTNGTMPMSGIDIEPNDGKGELKSIIIDRVITFNNRNFGIIVSLTALVSSIQKDINLTINNCMDDGSNYGMGYAFGRSKAANLIYAKGSINVINATWKNSRSGALWLPFYASRNSVKLIFKNPKVYMNGKAATIKPNNVSNSPNVIFK